MVFHTFIQSAWTSFSIIWAPSLDFVMKKQVAIYERYHKRFLMISTEDWKERFLLLQRCYGKRRQEIMNPGNKSLTVRSRRSTETSLVINVVLSVSVKAEACCHNIILFETSVEKLCQVSLRDISVLWRRQRNRVEEQKLRTWGSFSSRVLQETSSFLF